jgi:hypothetical protein
MIQIIINETEPMAKLIEARAAQSGRSISVVAEETIREGFETLLRTLHDDFMKGEISQGKMAELLGISRVDLIHLLEALDMQVTNL